MAACYFDVDGTLVSSNLVHPTLYYLMNQGTPLQSALKLLASDETLTDEHVPDALGDYGWCGQFSESPRGGFRLRFEADDRVEAVVEGRGRSEKVTLESMRWASLGPTPFTR